MAASGASSTVIGGAQPSPVVERGSLVDQLRTNLADIDSLLKALLECVVVPKEKRQIDADTAASTLRLLLEQQLQFEKNLDKGMCSNRDSMCHIVV